MVYSGKKVLITGANSGLGLAVAKGFARLGADLILLCRTRENGEKAVLDIASEVPNASIGLMICDLASMSSIDRFIADFRAEHTSLDLLFNNAAVMKRDRTVTEDGFEMMFQVNYLVYSWLGIDLAGCSDAVLSTLQLPPKILGPFLLIILLSWITPRVRRDRLDRYYAKMRTVVASSPEEDQLRLEEAWADAPARAQERKWFPRSNLEVERPTRGDVVGFTVCVGICFAILGLALFLARLGAHG